MSVINTQTLCIIRTSDSYNINILFEINPNVHNDHFRLCDQCDHCLCVVLVLITVRIQRQDTHNLVKLLYNLGKVGKVSCFVCRLLRIGYSLTCIAFHSSKSFL